MNVAQILGGATALMIPVDCLAAGVLSPDGGGDLHSSLTQEFSGGAILWKITLPSFYERPIAFIPLDKTPAPAFQQFNIKM